MASDFSLIGFGSVLMLGSIILILTGLKTGKRTARTEELPKVTSRDRVADSFHQAANQAANQAARQIAELQQQCLRLRQTLEQQQQQTIVDIHNATFEQLQTLLTSYPTARQMVRVKPDLPARNLIALLMPLENLLEDWGIAAIGAVWEQVPYDPQLHQPDVEDIAEGEPVYVRFVGYRQGDRILCPAQVSRTLPPIAFSEAS